VTEQIILKSFQSPGDIVMLSAAIRDLHQAHPNRFITDVRTSAPAIWENNPYLTPLDEHDPEVTTIDMHYPAIHQSNQRPYHFIHGYCQYLEQRLNLRIPMTAFRGDIHLSSEEVTTPALGQHRALPEHFWIMAAGGKYDFTAKWWDPRSYQAVVNYFRDRMCFVQCGEEGHWHPRLEGVVDLVGHTTLRELIRLVYHADGVVCPVTLAMHLAAAVPVRSGNPKLRPCVVIAGGREPPHWEAYSHHQFLHTVGMLACCADGGCWRSRCQLAGDGDAKDQHNVCQQPVQVDPSLRIPACMHMIRPADVIRCLRRYHEQGLLSYQPSAATRNDLVPAPDTVAAATGDEVVARHTDEAMDVAIDFRHGLGDAVQLTAVLRHLCHYHPEWNVDVAALVGKHSALHGLCRKVIVRGDHDSLERTGYQRRYALDWDECRTSYGDCPSTKVTQCLVEVFKLKPIAALCGYQIQRSARADQLARAYLEQVCHAAPDSAGRYPAVLIHYAGNTSADKKNLSHDLVRDVCDVVLAAGATPVILDWDRRSSLPDGQRIFNPDADHPMWGGHGTGDAEVLAALIQHARLMVGVDSGPLHVAGATSTETIGVWTQHHPVYYFDLADNVLHFVPANHEQLARGAEAVSYFQRCYQHQTYRELAVDLPTLVESRLTGEEFQRIANRRFLARLSAHAYDRQYHEEHRRAGLDYLAFGDWQQDYGRWLVDSLQLGEKRVLDVGCGCGAIARGLQQAGAHVGGVDLNQYMIQLGREKWPDMRDQLNVCDAVNLHLFEDGCWDAIHSAQVAEHWKPELVPHILDELKRVVVPGGAFFCTLDTEELVTRQERDQRAEDPTHVCIRPMAWWHDQLEKAGWTVCSARFESALQVHTKSFFNRYDWDWFVATSAD